MTLTFSCPPKWEITGLAANALLVGAAAMAVAVAVAVIVVVAVVAEAIAVAAGVVAKVAAKVIAKAMTAMWMPTVDMSPGTPVVC